MSKVAVVFWSGTGNTEKMSEFVAEGIKANGTDAVIYSASEFNPEIMDGYDAIAFGCPSMGAEELEESEFQPMFSACGAKLKGKNIALFGSYGWGDGEWMRKWEEECLSLGANFVIDSVICNEVPDENAKNDCIALGKKLAEQ